MKFVKGKKYRVKAGAFREGQVGTCIDANPGLHPDEVIMYFPPHEVNAKSHGEKVDDYAYIQRADLEAVK